MTASSLVTVATRNIRSRYRDVNGKINGVEGYRLALDGDHLVWADKHPDAIVTDQGFPRCSLGSAFRAGERKGADLVDLPVGTLIVDIEHAVSRGKKSAPTYTAGWIVAEGKAIDYNGERSPVVQHVGVKKRGTGYTHVIDIGGERKEFQS